MDSVNLKKYVNRYGFRGQIIRLLYIADKCPHMTSNNPSLRKEAYRLGMDIARKAKSTYLFSVVMTKAMDALGESEARTLGGPGFNEWIQDTEMEARKELNKLETNLQKAKSIGDPPVIYGCYLKLASFFEKIGNSPEAHSKLLESREFEGSSTVASINLLENSILIGNYGYINFHANRIKTKKGASKGDLTKARIAMGLYYLRAHNFEEAAVQFTSCDYDSISVCSSFISASDICTYACLCALSTLSREGLASKVLQNEGFRKYLELKPEWEKCVKEFMVCKYQSSCQMLHEKKDTLKMDVFVGSHTTVLLESILDRAMELYFKPYTAVHLSRMATAFGLSLEELEKRLVTMISAGKINGRIDSFNGALVKKGTTVNVRYAAFQKGLELGQAHVHDCRATLLRMALKEHRMVVQSEKDGDESSMGDGGSTGGDGVMGGIMGGVSGFLGSLARPGSRQQFREIEDFL